MKTLSKKTMIDSYSYISLSPDKRGEQDYKYYSKLLKNDLKLLGEKKENYKEKFIDKVMLIYYRQLKCACSFIVGLENLNPRRSKIALYSRDKAYLDFNYWRSEYLKFVSKKL